MSALIMRTMSMENYGDIITCFFSMYHYDAKHLKFRSTGTQWQYCHSAILDNSI